jgi:hypothetical protein
VINLKTAKTLGLTPAVGAAAGGSGDRVVDRHSSQPDALRMLPFPLPLKRPI